ncbi:MAG: hypothetical protein SGI97_10445 [candidate division Zixibacteria bacterium]|nr:hypothetical protein [candidate division Zixibacteria bacterium]
MVYLSSVMKQLFQSLKIIICLICILYFAAVSAFSVGDTSRTVAASESVESFRPVGEVRLWTFSSGNKSFGQLISKYVRNTKINDRPALVFEEQLKIDYRIFEVESDISVIGEHYISPSGQYLGDKLEITANKQSEAFEMLRDGNTIEGFFTRGGENVSVNVTLPETILAWEPNFVDQLEILMAMRALKVNDTIVDSIYMPQAGNTARVIGTIPYFMYQELWKNRFDSVFIIHLTEPQVTQLYFTADKRLVRVDFPQQKIRVYQDSVAKGQQENPQTASSILVSLVAVIPHAFAYSIIAIAAFFLFTGKKIAVREAGIALIIGLLLFLPVIWTLVPLQKYLINKMILSAIRDGESIYLLSLLPAFVGGVLQEILKLASSALFQKLKSVKNYRLSLIGAVTGAGFGLAEAIYLTVGMITPLFSMNLLERSFLVLFHTATSALLGSSLALKNVKAVTQMLALTIAVNLVLRYLPVLVQQKIVSVGWLYLILAVIVVTMTTVALFVLKRKPSSARA